MNITCQDCSAVRANVQYVNTRYCESCRLLRNLLFVGATIAECGECGNDFAPVARGDRWCGTCSFTGTPGTCVLCKGEEAERLRPSIAVCKGCARDPKQRVRLVKALRKGQAARRA